jgi:hypothetical protein
MSISKLIMVKTNLTLSDIVLVLKSFDVFCKIGMHSTIKLDPLHLFCMCPRESFTSLLNLVDNQTAYDSIKVHIS